jgi:paraquat-inducible protein B
VREIALAPPVPDGLRVPVRVELDAARLRELAGGDGGVQALVRRGMVGRLATQSLLTGQLYVDLDMPAGAPVDTSPLATSMAPAAPAEIPTVPGALAGLQAQLQTVDLAGLARDLAATAQAARQWLDAPAWERTLAQTQTAAASLTRLAQAWEEQAAPIGADTLATLAEARQALQDSRQTLTDLRQSADALGRAAQSWQALAADDSVLRHDAQQALQDVSRAARALRELSESLERQPDALWRGRAPSP